MPMNFSQPKIESQDILALQERIAKLEAQLQESPKEKPGLQPERVKQEIRDYIHEVGETPSFATDEKLRDEAKEIQKFPSSQQVGALIELVFDKGLGKAMVVARELDPAILDELHDSLVPACYERLMELGIIKPE